MTSAHAQPAVDVRVGGVSLSTIAGWGDLEVTHDQHGPYEISWGMSLRPGVRPSPLRRGGWVTVHSGSGIRASGPLVEPDWNSSSFTATGIGRAAEGVECFNEAGDISTKLDPVLDAGIARGALPWVRGADFGDDDLAGPEGGVGVSDPEPGKVVDLLVTWADGTGIPGRSWRTTPTGLMIPETQVDTNPVDWIVLHGADELGVAGNVVGRVSLRYLSSTDGVYRTASYPAETPAGGVEQKASIINLGPMNATRATTIAEGVWHRVGAGRAGFTNGLDLRTGQITTPGGLWADLSLIRPGQVVQVQGQPDPRDHTAGALRFVIGRVVWRPAERRIQIDPVGLDGSTIEQAIEDILTGA